jgi:ribosomal protein S21
VLSLPFHTKITILREIKQRVFFNKIEGKKKKMRKKKTHFKQKNKNKGRNNHAIKGLPTP